MNGAQKNVIMICVIIIAVCFVSVQFLFGKKYQDTKTAQKTLELDNQTKKSRLESINNIISPLTTLETAMAQIDLAGLPQGDALPETIEQVESLMKTVEGFTVTSFSPTLTKSIAGGVASNQNDFTLSVSGDPAKLNNLFDAFASSIRPMYVKNLIISPIAGSTSVNIALSMVTFNGSGSSEVVVTNQNNTNSSMAPEVVK
jgi:Tfp pilus assembly protein PilO